MKKISNPSEKKDEPRVCPRCHGEKFDPYHHQDYCHRCGGTGKVYGPESNFQPSSFVD